MFYAVYNAGLGSEAWTGLFKSDSGDFDFWLALRKALMLTGGVNVYDIIFE